MGKPVFRKIQYLKSKTKAFLLGGELLFAYLIFKFFFAVNNNCVLTCNRNDGGGAQVHGRLTVLAFAEYFGVTFLNTPMSNVHFGNGKDVNTADPEWDSKWNSLVNFQNLNPTILENRKLIRCSDTTGLWKTILRILMSFKAKELYVFEMESAHKFTDLKPKVLNRCLPKFQNLLNPAISIFREEIVIHRRRGEDITAAIRFLSDDTMNEWLRTLRIKYPSKSIRIYTNESFELHFEFQDFLTVDSESSPFEAISHMAQCEVLIIAKSSMSYVAALMNKNIVYCPSFWHPKMETWNNSSTLES